MGKDSAYKGWLKAPAIPPLVRERKLVADDSHVPMALDLLATACLPDPEFPVGRIRSIYFDLPDLRFFDEKANGDNLKRKIRMRWYAPDHYAAGDMTPVFIEHKFRIGAARHKLRHRCAAAVEWITETPLSDASITDFLYQAAADMEAELPLGLVPVACIAYTRRRYVCPFTGCRVALDDDIHAERMNTQFFPQLAAVRLSRTVCEFKHVADYPPPWLHSLLCAGFRMRSFSKYGECLFPAIHGGMNE